MKIYSFLHNLELLKGFDVYDYSMNIAEMHDKVDLHETRILEQIQLTFDWTRSWDCKPRYNVDQISKDDFAFTKTWSLYNIDSNWNIDIIKKGAKFLSEHLNYLTEYIIDVAYTIMGECLGYKVYNRRFIIPKDDKEYKEFIELGKYHLAFLMKMVEELGKLGIDCRAIKINTEPFFIGGKVKDCLETKSSLGEIRRSFDIEGYWDFSRNNYSSRNYLDKDFSYEKDKIYRTLLFNDLEEFILALQNNIERLNTFNDEMINPDTLDFANFYYKNDAIPNLNYLPDGEFVNTNDCLTSFLAKLRNGDFIKAYYDLVNKRKLAIPKDLDSSEKKNNQISRVSLNANILETFIKYLLSKNYICYNPNTGLKVMENIEEKIAAILDEFNKENQDNLGYCTEEDIRVMIEIIFIFNFNITNIYFNSNSSNKDELVEELLSRVEILEKRHDDLEKKVTTLSSDFETLKLQIINYLETGTNKPNFDNLDKNQVIKIVENYKPTTVSSKFRKMFLIALLSLGLMLTFKGQEIPNLTQNNEIVSKAPIETVVEEPIHGGDIPSYDTPEKTIAMNILDENTGFRNYYISIYDENKTGMTEQDGRIIRYFAFKDNQLVCTLGTEQELQDFIKANNVLEFTWKVAVSCLDYEYFADYVDNGVSIPLEYTTFFADYVPSKSINRERK